MGQKEKKERNRIREKEKNKKKKGREKRNEKSNEKEKIEEALNGAKNAGKPVTKQRVTITNFLVLKKRAKQNKTFTSIFLINCPNLININYNRFSGFTLSTLFSIPIFLEVLNDKFV